MKEKALQVLLVEDNAGDARLLREMFSTERPGSFELTHLLRMSEAVIHLAKGGTDVVLLDMGLPDGHGLDTVRRAHAAAPGVPVIVLTGLDDEALAAEAMKEGAQDYLIKGQIENRALPRALRHAIERHRMQTETSEIKKLQLQLKDDFLSHVSHELRSPLAAVQSSVEVTLNTDRTIEEYQDLLCEIADQCGQLRVLVNQLLLLAETDAVRFPVEKRPVRFDQLLEKSIDMFRGAAEERGINLISDIRDQIMISGDGDRLRQVVNNLIDNSLKFTLRGGQILISELTAAAADTANSRPEVVAILREYYGGLGRAL